MAEESDRQWWHRPIFVTLLTALVGAMVPLAAGVQGYIQKERELELEREQHKQSIRLHYLDILVGSSLKDVELFLTFISDTDENPDLKRWAVTQLGNVRKRIGELEKDKATADKRAGDAEAALAAALEEQKKIQENLKVLQARASASEAQRKELQEEARRAQAALSQAQRNADTRRAEAADKDTALARRRPMAQMAPDTNAAIQEKLRALEQKVEGR